MPRQSVFGTVTEVNGLQFRLRREAPHGYLDIHMPDNDVRAVGGVTLRPGVFAGVFGCLPPQSHDFISEEVTISSSEATYPRQYRYSSRDTDSIYGRVDTVRPDRLLVRSTAGRDTWVITHRTGIATGQTVRVIGYFKSNGTFVADTVTVVQ